MRAWQSDNGIWYPAPPEICVPRHPALLRGAAIGVYYKTEICDCDSRGNVIFARPGNEGFNTITDWGMDSLATLRQDQLVNYLHLSDTLGTAKRVLTGGVTLSLTITDASNIAVASSAGFFVAGDVGKTLSIDSLGGAGKTQELKITAFTDAQHVTCSTRAGLWLPGFTPGTGPFGTAGVHATDTSTLANQFTKFNTYDTGATNFNAELNDSSNSRFIHQRIFLSGAAGSTWTINQLGWSDGNAGNNVFGKVNLASPDVVATGKKYRVQLQLFSAYAPIDIASQSINWGATIGTYDLAFRQERIPFDSSDNPTVISNLLRPKLTAGSLFPAYWTGARSLGSILWQGDTGYSTSPQTSPVAGSSVSASDSSYASGQHTKVRTIKWDDTVSITSATLIGLKAGTTANYGGLSIKPNSGTITKPSGFVAQLDFRLFWTRAFVN